MKKKAVDIQKLGLIATFSVFAIYLLIELFSVEKKETPPQENIVLVSTQCESTEVPLVDNYATQYVEARMLAISRVPPNRARNTDVKYGRSAMIWAGQIGTALQHAHQIRQHLLEPNDMDVYALIDRTSALLSRYGEKDARDPEELLNQVWGNRLKGLWFIEEDVGFRITTPINYAQNELRLSALEVLVDKYREKGLNITQKLEDALHWESGIAFSYPYSRRWNWWAVDQYSRLQRLAQLAKPLILDRGYKTVLRFRADVEFTEDVNFTPYEIAPNRTYVIPHTGGTITETWLAEANLGLELAEAFIEDYLKYIPNVFRHSDIVDHNDMLYWVLAPQAAFMQMVRRNHLDVRSLCYEFHQVDSRMDNYKQPLIKTLRFVKQDHCSSFHPAVRVVDDYVTYRNGEYVELITAQ